MTTIELSGRITESGQLEIELPIDFPPGEVRITIKTLPAEPSHPESPWTAQEIMDMLTFRPVTGPEIVASGALGGWADQSIEDSQAWVDDQRRKRQERRKWSRD